MSATGFSHPNFGRQVQVKQQGREVRLIFTAGTRQQADSLFDELLRQLKGGAVNITLMGKPTSIEEG